MSRKSRIESVRECLIDELKQYEYQEICAARDKDYVGAGHCNNICVMLKKVIELCREEKPKEDKKENE